MSNLFDECDENEKKMLQSAYNVISRMEMWDFLKNYTPPKDTGFMFDNNSKINDIQEQIQKAYDYNHSGWSMAFTMRKMEEIAKQK
jgi:hypothetical protein